MLKRIFAPAFTSRPVFSGNMSPFLPTAYSLRKPPPSLPPAWPISFSLSSPASCTRNVTAWCVTFFAPGAGFGSIDDIFQAFFSGSGIRFTRGPMRGQDLVHQVEITAIDAMLGTSVKVPTHEGEREIELPSGTQHGTQYALRGHGLPGSNGGPPGDMVLVVHVLIPSDLSEEQEELARKLGESLEPRNLRSSGAEEESFFSRMRRAFG